MFFIIIKNPYTTGLIVPNKEKIQNWLKQNKKSIDDDNALTEILSLIKEDIENVKNSNLPELSFPARWMPSTSVILPEAFTEHNKLLNSTMKVVRGKVEEYFQKEIEYLYTSDAKIFTSKQNKNNLKTIINS